MNDNNSLAHTSWNCKYHIVFAPKYRRKVFYGQNRAEIGKILRELCDWKGVHIVEAEVCPDHIHIPDEMLGGTVIFSDNILGTGQQTGNLPTSSDSGELYSNHFIYTEDKWNAIGDNGEYTEIKEKRSEYYIVFTDVYNWKDATYKKIRFCAGGASAPGDEMTFLGVDENGYNQYYIYVDRSCTSGRFYCTNKKTILKETKDSVVSGDCGYYPLSNTAGIICGTFDVKPAE